MASTLPTDLGSVFAVIMATSSLFCWFFSTGVREKPLKLPKKLTVGLMFPLGLLSESLRRRLELISSGEERVWTLTGCEVPLEFELWKLDANLLALFDMRRCRLVFFGDCILWEHTIIC